MFCKNCGKEIGDNSQFCWYCGTKVEVKVEEPKEKEIQKNVNCKYCNEEINAKADICPHCGMRLRIVVTKNPGIASVLSFFIPGLGQIYNGDITMGIAFVILEILSLSVGIMVLRLEKQSMLALAFVILCAILWIYGIYNAYKNAEKINSKIE